jgi:hypothetical protein
MPMFRRLLAATLLAVVVAGCGDDPPPSPTTTTAGAAAPSTTAAPPTTLSAKAELPAAYDNSWRVYADALRRLDPSRLPTAFAGSALRAAQQEITTQKANNQPVRIDVEHRSRVLRVTVTDGLVEDHYRNHSVVLDPTSGAPAEPDPNEVVYQRQSLKRIDGAWKVVEVIEEQRP